MKTGNAMLLNGEERFTLAVIRSMDKKGIKTIVGGNQKHSRSFYSKHVAKHFYYPPVELDPETAHKTILGYVKKYKPSVLFPMSLDTCYIVLKRRAEYERYTSIIPLPSYKEFCSLDNKAFQIKLAKKNNILCPKTYFPKTIEGVKRISKKITYPVLLKPLVSAGGYSIRYVTNAAQLTKDYKNFRLEKKLKFYNKNTFLIQECIPVNSKYAVYYRKEKDCFIFQHNSQHVTVYVLFNHGELVGLFANTYEDPTCNMLFSNHYTAVSVKNEKLVRQTTRLFKGIKFHGCASVQYLLDTRDNTYKFIEINPRIWGSLESAIKAGVDFPYMMYELALGKKVRPVTEYREGLKFKWVVCGEMYRIFKSRNKIKTLTDIFKPNTAWEISFRDPLPHLIHLVRSFYKIAKL